MDKVVNSAVKIAFIYAIFAGLWILFSDLAVETFIDSSNLRALAQTYKGLVFVFITAMMLLVLVYRNNRALEKTNDLDSLTGLHSINMFIRSLDKAIGSLHSHEKIILGYLDIDDFKALNETIGFDRADMFLRDLASDITKATLARSVTSRLHADQFASFAFINTNEAFDMDAHVLSFQRLFAKRAKQNGINVTCCIGVALYPTDGENAKELMVSATEALEIAKKQQNAIQYHDKALTEIAMQRRQLVLDLRQAIKDEALTVVYQPKYNLNTLTISGVEVLVRWIDERHGFVSPADFIPLAEDNHLTNAISKLVVGKAAKELAEAGLLNGVLQHIAVNVSATEFNNQDEMRVLTQFIKSLEHFAPFVRLEITETATLTDMKKSVDIIADLQQQGITLSIDDFGTGYTSLTMLKDLTVDEIKIDRSFISEIEHDERSKTIVNAIIVMAKSFGVNIVAEGIETDNQLKLLQDMGCIEAQGFLLAKPMPINELVTHLQEKRKIH
ncbi:bifunctional diguanylate cyclase/phosphodiesterase [Thalassotalea sp. 1_MG-2023]|uniref:putative bifunctional diguanylate cyclase/phosphodiesterase n=1 Tax=Thalassotalea sp. 1_MG-2023 TaxID=3062680 RepID=UPI0026E1578E|nr:bifunctional diguanylate cyclase/phosphodiesterase [Thalassotalea sp. 1_MG-2023]MDO6426078.1 bifunctional diguanylate cyclase/phosphodiesterase [Thalassotalea sp. 1_MG-2023]